MATEPRIFCCQPSYGHGNLLSGKQFWTGGLRTDSPLRGKVDLYAAGARSLLANLFNLYWAAALNAQEKSTPYTHFAMLHDDVVPDNGWIDTLYEDLQSTGADLISAVVPIKEVSGVTSTAIDDPTNRWRVEKRLTIHEINKLPDIFTAADCGYPDRALLVNTGCWMCDLTKDWRYKVLFTINDRITRDKQGNIVVDVEPEDWCFSRQLYHFGADVRATKRVILSHVGTMLYINQGDWGAWKTDQAKSGPELCSVLDLN